MKCEKCECFTNVLECPQENCENCPAKLKSEAEIRAEVIDEFASLLKKEYPIVLFGPGGPLNDHLHKAIDKIALKLKGE